MAPRRLLVLLGLVGLTLAGLVLPVAAQTAPAPTITISPSSDEAGTSGTWSIIVSGQNWQAKTALTIRFAADPAVVYTPPSSTWSTTITPARRFGGPYTVAVRQDVCGDGCFRDATAQFRSIPQISVTPACSTPGSSQSATVNGSNWNPQFEVTVTYDAPSNNAQVVSPATNGTFSAVFTVTAPNRDVVITAEQGRTDSLVRAVWQPCPPPGTTTTTSSTTTTAPPMIVPDPDPTPDPTTTTRPDDPPPATTPVTVPPAIELPPPTPGATLTVSPEIGPPGFVTGVTGTGFPPGPVVLVWSPGIGTTTTVAGPDGTISARVLIFPGDRLGSRALLATGGAVTAFDAFLVVPSTVQPSGQNVAQINRIRRFNNR